MRIYYLKLALLAGALATKAPADSKSLRVVHTYAYDYDDDPVPMSIRTQKQVDADDEERRCISFAYFAKKVLLSDKDTLQLVERKAVKEVVRSIRNRASADQILSDQEVIKVSGDLLANKAWVKWAYFICSLNRSVVPRKNHEAIIKAMVARCDYNEWIKKLVGAAAISNSKAFAEALIQVMIDQRFQVGYRPDILFKLLRINSKMDNLFESEQFQMFSHYLRVQFGQQAHVDPYVFEFNVLRECLKEADLLKMLTLPGNAKHRRSTIHLTMLKEVWLNKKEFPSKIVFMLKLDKEHDNLFLNFEANRPAIVFWVNYWWRFCHMYPDDQETLMETLTKGLWPRADIVLQAAKNANDVMTRHFAFLIESTSTPRPAT